MKLIVAWDGSGHALDALQGVVALFRPRAFTQVECILNEWPPRDTAMWADVRARIGIDDTHDAAGEVVASAAQRLRTVVGPLGDSTSVSVTTGDPAENLRKAANASGVGLLLIAIGPHDTSGVLAETTRALVREASVPVLIVHAPATRLSAPM